MIIFKNVCFHTQIILLHFFKTEKYISFYKIVKNVMNIDVILIM